jgi:tRNA(fMet)-specific endonuclease VapC
VIVDTNALSAIAEGQPRAVAQLAGAQRLAIPVIVLGEYRFGIAQSRRKTEYERWLTETLTGYTVLEIGEETSTRYADIRVELKRAGTPIPANDTWIAALCRQHALPLMSQDKHFDLVTGIHRLGW